MCLIIRTIEFRRGSQHLGLGSMFLLKKGSGYFAGPGKIAPRSYFAGPGKIVPRSYFAGPGKIAILDL